MRDIVLANFFGAGAHADAFFVAFKIPNFFRRLFAEGAFNQAFVPVLNEVKTSKSHQETQAFISTTFSNLALVLLLVVALGVSCADWVIMVFAPGFTDSGEKYAIAVELLQLTFPYLLFISLTALMSGVLNSFNRFAIPAFTPTLLNIALISAALWFSNFTETPILALGWGVLAAGALQFMFQFHVLYSLKLLPKWSISWRHPKVKKVLKLMAPAIIGVSVVQVNLLVDTVIASFLADGSVSWLYYSDRLMEFPLGIFGIALATVILPKLSEQHSLNSSQSYSDTLSWALKCGLLIGTPAGLGLMVIASPILTTLFQYGEFSSHDTNMATQSLMAYSLGLPAFILIKILSAGYFAKQDTKTPVKFAIFAMLANLILNLILVGPLAHAGLALATTLSGFLNALLLFVGLKRKGFIEALNLSKTIPQISFAAIAMATSVWFSTPSVSFWQNASIMERSVTLLSLIFAAMVVYALILLILGVRKREFLYN